ncbi:hypothetical protein F53441_5074 [Fusarium austroafricanum]|uniref:Uncharacterized protein n=1 Tax=Fusarium austroafricanum TaxID=2364996 RepID=A0A8H4KKL6_9HYPO|nr:hypothetical protein F53441_5074 [Fusarium austroafricanum]
MFEVPEAKRVRREDLNASDDDTENGSDDGIQDAELRAKLNAQIARSLGLEIFMEQAPEIPVRNSYPTESNEPDDDDDDDVLDADDAKPAENDHEEEFAFRLFSKAPPAQKVVLEEENGPTGDGSFVSGRPLSYYVVTNISTRQKEEYAVAAMSGDQVLARSNDRAWGLELPWKVTKLTVTQKVKSGEKVEDQATKEKRRPGKKQRISLRKLAKAKEEKKVAEAKKMAEKEEHIKDKKKRMNRLKKLRKRAKAREQKQASKGEDGDDDSDADSVGSE